MKEKIKRNKSLIQAIILIGVVLNCPIFIDAQIPMFVFGENAKEIILNNEKQLYCEPTSFIKEPLKPTEDTKATVLYQIKNPMGTWFRVAIDKEPITNCVSEPIRDKIGFKYWMKEGSIPKNIRSQILDVEQFSKDSLELQSFRVDGNYIKEKVRECPSETCEIEWMVGNGGIATVAEKEGDWFRIVVSNFDTNHVDLFGGEGWVYESLVPENVKAYFNSQQQNQGTTTNESTSTFTQEEEFQNRLITFLSFLKNKNFQIGSLIFLIVLIVIIILFLLRKKIKGVFQFKLSKINLPKIKFKQKSFVASLPIILAITVGVAGISYGAVEYKKTSDLIKAANQLVKEEKYSEANDKLEVASNRVFVKTLGIKKQEINNQIEENKKLAEDKSSYDKGLDVLNNNNFQEAINILSALPEDSFYYQKAQTKIEESKRMIVEGKLSVETTAKLAAEAKAKQEEFEKKLKTQELANKEATEKMMNADNDGDGLTYRRELELGTSDWDTDSDNDGIRDNEDLHPAGGGRNQAQTFAWNYGGYDWTWTVNLHEDWYEYYKAKKPRPNPRSAEYITYNDPFIQSISKKISEGAEKDGLSKEALAASFVQSLSYVDDVYTGYDEYPKYPIETFLEKNGDCEDTSYLTASIIRAMNIDTVLILLPGHMAVGVWMDCNNSGTYYQLVDRCYYYIETTGEGFKLGEIPDKYKYISAILIKIPSGETSSNISPQYVKPCYISSDFPGYYSDGKNFYSDSQCNNLTYCVYYKEFYVNPQTIDFYWDSNCSQIVVKGCSKSTSYPGYFTNGIDYYSDSRCIQKTRICRPNLFYSDRYFDGYDNYWDSSCTEKVVSWCSKSIYYPGYFFNSIDWKIYVDYQCTQRADF